MEVHDKQKHCRTVTPLAGVWIEINRRLQERIRRRVTPLAGVWIEITACHDHHCYEVVTPLAGVWIEIHIHLCTAPPSLSLPLRECGLK